MNRKQKKILARIILAALLVAVISFLPAEGIPKLLLFLVPYLVIGYDILIKAARGIINGQVFDENFLMAIATVGALIIGALNGGDYLEAVAVMLFYQTGELFQSYAVGKSRKNISQLMDIRPDYANLECDGRLVKTDPDEVAVGSTIYVKVGERIPIDGIITEGSTELNTSALTGESMPRSVTVGDSVISGCVNMSGAIKVKTTKAFGESTVARILDLVENAGSRKSRPEGFISKFARVYTPTVCALALALMVFPPVISIILGDSPEFFVWIYRGLSFLVASCPCALVISIPLTFFGGLGGASKAGILIKGSNYLEMLSKTDTVVFDKTGTLTEGEFKVTEICPLGIEKRELLRYAAYAESASTHPIANGIRRAYGEEIDRSRVRNISEHSGNGVTAEVDGVSVALGKRAFIESVISSEQRVEELGENAVFLALDQSLAGYILLEDAIKKNSALTLKALKKEGISRTVMLSGDNRKVAERVADSVGIDTVYSELMPDGKVEMIEKIISTEKGRGKVAFVGDGINDAPVLSRADIGIAMGAMGSDAAIEAADVILMDDDPLKIVKAMRISKKALRIVYENIIFSIAVKVLALILVALGAADMWIAIFADVGVMIIAVLNAIRALFVKGE
ncbi:MAG: cadmium-translocating P-type ATPase [Ruminococcaceae bacterium]|nr:cadmium-translocating P-type ATPase [Oscillospiraceae bacterium]